jgi:Bacterial alpha-L-rhamnosidase C-terminal domain
VRAPIECSLPKLRFTAKIKLICKSEKLQQDAANSASCTDICQVIHTSSDGFLEHDLSQGRVEVYGQVHDSKHWQLNVVIPANTTASVHIPVSSAENIREGGKPVEIVKEIELQGIVGKYVVGEIGSGIYSFEVRN